MFRLTLEQIFSSRRSPVARKCGIVSLRFSSMLKPEIELQRLLDTFWNILALVLVKFRDKNRKQPKNINFRHGFELQVATLLLSITSQVI